MKVEYKAEVVDYDTIKVTIGGQTRAFRMEAYEDDIDGSDNFLAVFVIIINREYR